MYRCCWRRKQTWPRHPVDRSCRSFQCKHVKAFLEARCDAGAVSPNGFGPMYSVSFCGRGSPDAPAILQMLLSSRGDANARCKPRGLLYKECLRARVSAALWGLEGCTVYQRQMASLPGATALSIAAVMGDQRLVRLLLEHDAEHIANDRGDTPKTWRGQQAIRTCCLYCPSSMYRTSN